MKIPKKVKISGLIYDVVFEERESDLGCVQYENLKIILDSSAGPEKQAQTFLHEILHICNGALEEAVINPMAQVLFAALKDNKLRFE